MDLSTCGRRVLGRCPKREREPFHDGHVVWWSFASIPRGTQMTKAQSRTRTDRTELGWLFGLTEEVEDEM
jgi:hypothetical protein